MKNNRLASVLPPVLVGITGLAMWEGAVTVFKIEEFLLPNPSSIWTQLIDE